MANRTVQPMVTVSPRRQAFDRGVQRAWFGTLVWLTEHWLFIINAISFKSVLLPTLVGPWLLANGYEEQAEVIYTMYSYVCHQLSDRSFYLWGHQMAFCERDLGMFGAFFFFGMTYVLLRGRLKSLPLYLAMIYCAPMAIDGLTQLASFRESTWELRLVTGAFFGLATVWYTFPHFDLFLRLRNRQFRQELASL